MILQYVNDISYHSLTALSVVETNKASGIVKGEGPHEIEAIQKFNLPFRYWHNESKVSKQIILRQLFIHGFKQLYLFLMTIKKFGWNLFLEGLFNGGKLIKHIHWWVYVVINASGKI